MRTSLRFRGLRRRSCLVVLVLALMLSLLPTAAFASAGGPHMRPPAQQYSRQAPHNNYTPRQNYMPRQDDGPRWNYEPQHNTRYSGCDTTYRVRRGDTLSEIAQRYRVSVRALTNANRLGSPNRIYAGTTLCIPD
jgi:nucleoid-associated protein YgaU